MNELQQAFNYNGATVRTIVKNGEPWLVLKDVCDVLEIGNSRMVADRLDDDERDAVSITDTIGRMQDTTVINESGLYSVILLSRKPEARQFKRWVTHEVLPSIRKHGAYMTAETIEAALADPDTIIQLAMRLKEAREQQRALESKIEQDKPKVLFASAVEASHTSILIGELAKLLRQNGIEIGQNRLFQWMRDNGYLIKRQGSDWNMPTQYSMERGWFEVKETAISRSDGSITVSKTAKVTGRGQTYFVNAFLGA